MEGHRLTLDQKVNVIREYRKGVSQRALANRFNCGKTQIQTIISRRDYYLNVWKEKNGAKPGIKGKPPGMHTHEKLDSMLLERLTIAQEQNIIMTGPMLMDFAVKYAEKLKIQNFEATQEWLTSFKKHYSLNIPFTLEEPEETNTSSTKKSKFIRSNLSLAQRLLIIRKNESGISQRLLAKQFDCSKSLIQTIVANKRRYQLEWEESKKGRTKSSSEDSSSHTKELEECNGTKSHHPIIVSILRKKDSSGGEKYKVSNSSVLQSHEKEKHQKPPNVTITNIHDRKGSLTRKDQPSVSLQQNNPGSHSKGFLTVPNKYQKAHNIALYNSHNNHTTNFTNQGDSWLPLQKSKPLNYTEGHNPVQNNQFTSNIYEQMEEEETDESDFIEVRHSTLLNYVYATQYLKM